MGEKRSLINSWTGSLAISHAVMMNTSTVLCTSIPPPPLPLYVVWGTDLRKSLKNTKRTFKHLF